jgi:phosphoglycolate phosphatase-like HAD superfamily hydrolase
MVDPILGLLGISEYFRGVVGYGDTSMHKPHPAPLLKALKYLGLSASKDIWYVGDTEGDLNAARAVGLSFASALYGRGFPFEKANASLTKFSGILDL